MIGKAKESPPRYSSYASPRNQGNYIFNIFLRVYNSNPTKGTKKLLTYIVSFVRNIIELFSIFPWLNIGYPPYGGSLR